MPPGEARSSATARQKKLIHWGAKLLKLDEEAYRALLWGRTGKVTLLDMTGREAALALAEVERRLRAEGINPPWLAEYPEELRALGDRSRTMASQKQLHLIWRLWRKWRSGPGRRAKEPSDLKALGGFLRARFGVGNVRFLDRQKAKTVIDVLKEMGER